MMTSSNFLRCKANYLNEQEPFIVLSKEELVAERDNYYRIGETSIAVSSAVQNQLDKLIGLPSKQRKGLEEAFGTDAIVSLRNSFAMANCVYKPTSFALVANSKELIVDGIVPLKGQVIPMESYFNLLEMFIDKHSYEIEALESSHNGIYGITARLRPIHPQYDVFFGDDEFLTNGFYIKWNLGEIEVGNYYVRLVCSNGAFETVEHSLSRIQNLDDHRIMEFINTPKRSSLITHNLNRMKEIAQTASQTPASLNEVYCGRKLLIRHGAPDDLAEQLMPYSRLLNQYVEHGYGTHLPTSRTKSDIMMWDLYNNLTEFASHTTLWDVNDNRRSSLMQQSVGLLQRKRDIQPYYDIFSQ